MYKLEIKEELRKLFTKHAKRNPKQMWIIKRKTDEICENPLRYKNLRAPLNDFKRVHVDKSFVLLFSVDETTKTVILEDYDHHDSIYE